MNAPPRMNKIMITTIRSAAGMASGMGEYALAGRLWTFEAQLRSRDHEVVDVLTQLRLEYLDELARLVASGQDKSPTKNGYLRGLRRGLELVGRCPP